MSTPLWTSKLTVCWKPSYFPLLIHTPDMGMRNLLYSGLLVSDNIVPCLNFEWLRLVVPDVAMKVQMCDIEEGNLFQGFLAACAVWTRLCTAVSEYPIWLYFLLSFKGFNWLKKNLIIILRIVSNVIGK